MTIIMAAQTKHSFDPASKTIRLNERDIDGRFDTSYKIINRLGKSQTFEFKNSTGSEWDPATEYIYESAHGFTLIISQDAELTQLRADAYLAAKTRY